MMQSRSQEFSRTQLIVIGLILVVLELVFSGQVRPFGVSANLLFVLCALIALTRGEAAGAIGGFVCGLAYDMLGSFPVGLCPLLWTLAGYMLGKLNATALREGVARAALPFAVVDLVTCALHLSLLAAFGIEVSLGIALVGRVVAQVVIDTLIASLVFAYAHHRIAHGDLSQGLL